MSGKNLELGLQSVDLESYDFALILKHLSNSLSNSVVKSYEIENGFEFDITAVPVVCFMLCVGKLGVAT